VSLNNVDPNLVGFIKRVVTSSQEATACILQTALTILVQDV